MRTGTITTKLTLAALGLGVAAVVAAAGGPMAGPADTGNPFRIPVAAAAPAGPQGPVGADGKKADDPAKKAQDNEGKNIDPVTGTQVKNTSVIQYINAVYIWVAFIGGLIAVISLIYAGYSYMGSYGDPEKIAGAKDIVEKTLIGLSLLILAALILNTINPRTVTDPCKPNEPGCGDIDFSKPGGGVQR